MKGAKGEKRRCPRCGRDIVVSPTGFFVVHWTKPPRLVSTEPREDVKRFDGKVGGTFVPRGKLCSGSSRAPEGAQGNKGTSDEHV